MAKGIDEFDPNDDFSVLFDPSAPYVEAKTTAGDVAKSLGAGVVEGIGAVFQGGGNLLAQGINRGADAITGRNPMLRAVDPLEPVSRRLRESRTEGGKLAQELSTPAGSIDDLSSLSFGEAPTAGGYLQNLANVVGQFAVPAGVGAVSKAAKLGAAAQYGIGAGTGALQAGGAASGEEGERVRGMDFDALAQASSGFRDYIATGMNPAEARERTALDAELGAGTIGAIPAAAEGAILQGLFRGKLKMPALGDSRAAQIGTAAIGGGIGEAGQEVTEGAAQRLGANIAAGLDTPLLEDSFANAVLGFGGGAVAGAGFKALETSKPTIDELPPAQPPAGPLTRAVAALPAPTIVPQTDPAAELDRQRKAMQADEDAARLYAERDVEEQRRELAMASQGLDVGALPEEITLRDGRELPKAAEQPAPSTRGIEVDEIQTREPEDVTLSQDDPSTDGIDVGEFRGALPAPDGERPGAPVVTGPDGAQRRQTYAESADADARRADAESASGRATGFPATEREIRNPKTGEPWNNYMAANAALKKRADAAEFEIKNLGGRQFVLSRREQVNRDAPIQAEQANGGRVDGEIRTPEVVAAGDGRRGADAPGSAAVSRGNDGARPKDGRGADGDAAGAAPDLSAPASVGGAQPEPAPALTTAAQEAATDAQPETTQAPAEPPVAQGQGAQADQSPVEPQIFTNALAANRARAAMPDKENYRVSRRDDGKFELRRADQPGVPAAQNAAESPPVPHEVPLLQFVRSVPAARRATDLDLDQKNAPPGRKAVFLEDGPQGRGVYFERLPTTADEAVESLLLRLNPAVNSGAISPQVRDEMKRLAREGFVVPAGQASMTPATDDAPTPREAAAEAFKREHQKRHSDPREVENVASRMVDRLMSAIEAKAADTLIDYNLGDAKANPASRAAFEAATGVKLPKGRKATHEAIDAWAGVTPEERTRREQAKADRRAAENSDRDARADEDRASRFRLMHDGKEKSGKQFVDEIIAAGFDRVELRKKGVANITHLVHADGRSYTMLPDFAKYARRAAEAVSDARIEADSAEDAKQPNVASDEDLAHLFGKKSADQPAQDQGGTPPAGAGSPRPKPESAPTAADKNEPNPAPGLQVSANTIFTEDAAAKARALLRKKLGQLNTGIDPEIMQAGITLAGYHIEKGARTFAAYARAMLADLGDSVKPYLKSWYMGVKYDPRASDFEGMSSAADVESADIDAITVAGGSDERTGVRSEDPAALDEVAPEEGGRAEGGRQPGPGDSGRGEAGTAADAGSDGTGVSGARSGGGRSGRGGAAAAGGRRGTRTVGAQGTRRKGKRVPETEPVAPEAAPSIPAQNFRITPDLRLGAGGEVEKFNDNIAAIRALKAIESERRRASPEEQRILARYVGWGGLANAFPDPKSGEHKKGWTDRGAALKELLTPSEYAAARRSTRNAHYTSETVVSAMWQAAQRLGFRGGLALESSMGTGNFLGLMPDGIPAKFIGVEYDSLTSRIAGALYPQAAVINSGFQYVPLAENAFALNIGNPPFGSESLRFQFKPELNGVSIHNQFFLAGIDAVRPGGLQIMVVSRYLMDAQDATARKALATKAKLVAAIRLPDSAFKENARTEVVTDIVILQRHDPDTEKATKDAFVALGSKEGPSADQRALIPEWVETATVPDPLGGEPMVVNRYFKDNPEQILGTMDRSGSMQQDSITVTLPAGELQAALDAAIQRLPEGISNISDEVMARTQERFELLGEAMRIAAAREEPGHMGFNADGKLTRVTEREAPDGGLIYARQTITESSPWSEQLALDADGRWFRYEVEVGEDGKPVKEVKNGKATKRNVYKRTTFMQEADVPGSLRLGKAGYERLTGMVNLRDLLKRQLVLETEDAAPKMMEANRKKLAAAYEAFVAEHGPINRRVNLNLAMTMPDGGLIAALEVQYQPARTKAQAEKSGLEAQEERAEPAPILRERVVPKYEPATSAATAADALVITLSERGVVDMERIAELRGVSPEAAAAELQAGEKPLVFMDPETQRWETADAYLSGQVRRKLNAAREAGMEANIKALEAVQPEPWTAEQVNVSLGSTAVPPGVYAEFAESLFGGRARVSHSALTNAFTVDVQGEDKAKLDQWSSDGASGPYILGRLLNSQTPVVTFTDSDGNTRFDKERTELAVLKSRELVAEFGDWVFKDGDRRKKLVDIYNEKFNTRVNRQFDGSHLSLPGKVPDTVIALRRHQKNAIWRGIASRFLLMDHVVGAGKTFTGIARAMERRRMGLARKPAVIVPNHLVEQWSADIYRLYPGAKILAAGQKDFESKRRRRLFGKIATGDWDMVVIPHSSFGFIGIAPETEMRFLEQELKDAQAAIEEAWEEARESGQDQGFRKPFGVKEAERLAKKIRARMDKLREGARDRLLTFEQLGIDDLTVDEAHEFKNLFYSSRLTGVRGMGNKTGSRKAADLYNKVRVLRENGGAVTFMTGTPVSNSVVELYTMMRYLAADELAEQGLTHFDAWRAEYVEAVPAFEPTESGGLKEVTRLGRTWSNMRAMMDLYYQFADAVSIDDIKKWYAEDNGGKPFPVPKVKGGDRQLVKLAPTPAQAEALDEIVAGFDGLDSIKDPKERNIARLRLMDRARKVSLDIRAVDPTSSADEKGGKLDRIAQEVKRLYDASSKDRGAQLVFLDRGVPKSKGDDAKIQEYDRLVAEREQALRAGDEDAYQEASDRLEEKFDANEVEALRAAQAGGWTAYQQLKDNLIALGVPAGEIRFVQEANTDEQKEALFDAVRGGKVRVLIGSTPRMGAGTNVQDRLVALHHADVTWKPSDIEQREGRIIRQGNNLLEKYGPDFEVEILAYATERTVDAKMWDLNATKLRAINSLRKYDGSFTMEIEDAESASMAEMAALASGNPLLLERVKLEQQIKQIELLERAHRRRVFGVMDAVADAKRIIAEYPARIEAARATAAQLRERIREVEADAAARTVTVEGQTYSTRFDAMRAAQQAIDAQRAGDEKARFSISVNGQRITSKQALDDSIDAALGGDHAAFMAQMGGEKVISRTVAARAIAEDANRMAISGREDEFELGELFGYKLVGSVTVGWRGKHGNKFLELALMDAGRTVASMNAAESADTGQFMMVAVRNGLGKLVERARDLASPSDGDYLQRQLDRAQSALPDLEAKAQDTAFPKAAELREKRERLNEVVRALQGTGAAPAATQGDSDIDLSAADINEFRRQREEKQKLGEFASNMRERVAQRVEQMVAEAEAGGHKYSAGDEVIMNSGQRVRLLGKSMLEDTREPLPPHTQYKARREAIKARPKVPGYWVEAVGDPEAEGWFRGRIAEWGIRESYRGLRPVRSTANDDMRAGLAFQSETLTAEDIKSILEDRFGKRGIERLIAEGILNIRTLSELKGLTPAQQDAAARGALRISGAYSYSQDAVTLVVDAGLTRDEIVPTLIHELGEHFGLQKFLGKEAYAKLLDYVRTEGRLTSPGLVEAWASVASRSAYSNLEPGSDRFVREVIASYAEKADEKMLSEPWFKRVLAAIRRFFWTYRVTNTLRDDDIRRMVIASARQAMRSGVRRPGQTPLSSRATANFDLSGDSRAEIVDVGFEANNGARFARITRTASGAWHDYFLTRQDAENGQPRRIEDRADEGLGEDGRAEPAGQTAARYDRDDEGRSRFLARYQQAAFRSVLAVRQAAAQGRIQPDPQRVHQCFAVAAEAAAAGDFDMVIGIATLTGGGRGWHAVVRLPDGGIFDPVEKQFYAKGVYEKAGRFAPVREMTPETVRRWLVAHDGAPPEPRALGFDGENSDLRAGDDLDLSARDFNVGRLNADIRQRIGDLFETKRTFNWWHKSVGTQYHKATIDRDYRRVFERGQAYITDLTRLAMTAADQAPEILPRLERIADIAKAGASPRDLKPVAEAMFTGTLVDERVYADAELRDRFRLNPKQIRLYRQARAAIDRSLEDMATSEMIRLVRIDVGAAVADQAAAAGSMRGAYDVLAPALAERPELIAQLDERVAKIAKLKHEGYAPLMRFGRYSVTVSNPDGSTEYFGLFEDEAEARRMEREMREQYPQQTVTRGVMSEEGFRMFRGLSPDTLELFAEAAGIQQSEALQQYLKLAVNSRSALKRLIRRKGIAGYNPDVKRVLAQFVTSNARAASGNLHYGEMMRAVEAIPREKGDVRDEAIRLMGFLQDPQEEASRLRSFLFFNFLGGSVAAAAVNMTQPVMMSFPYLARWGAARAAKELIGAGGNVSRKWITDPALRAAMDRAAKEGLVEPHQIFELQGAAMHSERDLGPADPLRSAWRKGVFVWGRLFSLAEAFNRRLTFAAAFKIGRELSPAELAAEGVSNAYEFAAKAVHETQGVYNRGNRPDWARGAVGATLFTFKQYSIAYMEFLKRLPPRERALALGVLILAAGVNGLPGADDLDDLIDTVAENLGYNLNSKARREQFVAAVISPVFGAGGAEFVNNGMSAALPIDVQARLGLQNLIPGTGVGLKSTRDKGREVTEALGPFGGLVENVGVGISAGFADRAPERDPRRRDVAVRLLPRQRRPPGGRHRCRRCLLQSDRLPACQRGRQLAHALGT
jgi:N12 class adenine-specific DNA methylase